MIVFIEIYIYIYIYIYIPGVSYIPLFSETSQLIINVSTKVWFQDIL